MLISQDYKGYPKSCGVILGEFFSEKPERGIAVSSLNPSPKVTVALGFSGGTLDLI